MLSRHNTNPKLQSHTISLIIKIERRRRPTLIYAALSATQAQTVRTRIKETENSLLNLKVIFNLSLKIINYGYFMYIIFIFLHQMMENVLLESKEPGIQVAVLSSPDTALRPILMQSSHLRNKGRSQGEVMEDLNPNLLVWMILMVLTLRL